jgi:hypothetical protein
MSDLRNLTFEHLLNYIAVVETGSFTRAAERRGVGKTTVSDSIQRQPHGQDDTACQCHRGGGIVL